MKLFENYKLGNIILKNRIVMSPMTRSRAIGNIPNELMVIYYSQRATAGLIITEGTSPSPNGLGYARIPGIFSKEQIEGWKKITSAVHIKEGKIFLQLMHTGRIGHQFNLPDGAQVLAPSAIKPAGQMRTDKGGIQDYPTPKEMNLEEISKTIHEYIQAGINAVEAGFDGIEFHGANGYMIEQFLSPITNQRIDDYGGNIVNRCRFVLEVVEGTSKEIGSDKIGIRFSPYGAGGDMHPYNEIDETYTYLTDELSKMNIAYIHVVDHSKMGAPIVPLEIKQKIRNNFRNSIILAGGYDKVSAERDLESNICNLITFGKPFINNPDLVYRLEKDLPLSTNLDVKTFYTADEIGYTDYPFYQE